MKKSIGVYLGLMVTLAVILLSFEITTLSMSFNMFLKDQEKMNQNGHVHYKKVLESSLNVNEDKIDQESLSYIASTIYRGIDDQDIIYKLVLNDDVVFSSHQLNTDIEDISDFGVIKRKIQTYSEETYLVYISKLDTKHDEVVIYTYLNISQLYVNRDALMVRYNYIVLIIMILFSIGLYFLIQNFEKQIRMSEEVNQLSAIAEKHESFTASFAHESRTPLTSILGYTELLKSNILNDKETEEAITYIHSESKRLEGLTNQMMILSNLKSSDVRCGPIDIIELANQSIKNLEEKLTSIKLNLSLKPASILGEADLILSLLINVIDNSSKSDTNQIDLLGTYEDGGYVLIIKDYGKGMDAETLSHIKEPFYMADQSRSRQAGGAGLGLTIVSKIVDVLDLTLSITSEPYKGTEVRIGFKLSGGDQGV